MRDFFSQLFDWKVTTYEYDTPYYTVESSGDGSQPGISGGIMQAPEGVPPHVTFYVTVDDIQAHLKQAESLGGRTVMPPRSVPSGGTIAIFLDPEQNPIGLFQADS